MRAWVVLLHVEFNLKMKNSRVADFELRAMCEPKLLTRKKIFPTNPGFSFLKKSIIKK